MPQKIYRLLCFCAAGKGEKVGQEPTAFLVTKKFGKPHLEQDQTARIASLKAHNLAGRLLKIQG